MSPPTLLSICICTFRRPEGLRRAISSLLEQAVPDGLEVEIVVVDNDPEGSARPTFDALRNTWGHTSVVYLHETKPGISFARNRCLEAARGLAIAFLDDDEIARPNWLSALWETMNRYRADAVFGPVLPEFAAQPPAWLSRSGAHQRPRFATGTPIAWGDSRTGNVLMSRRLVDLVGEFDLRFGLTGGEDSFFFGSAAKKGARLVWCDEAQVEEVVPTARMQRRWLLRRAFLGGRTFTRLRAELNESAFYYVTDGLRGLGAVVVHGLPTVLMWALGLEGHFRHARKVAGGLGKMGASFIHVGDYGKEANTRTLASPTKEAR